jgi:hypothetical protein
MQESDGSGQRGEWWQPSSVLWKDKGEEARGCARSLGQGLISEITRAVQPPEIPT